MHRRGPLQGTPCQAQARRAISRGALLADKCTPFATRAAARTLSSVTRFWSAGPNTASLDDGGVTFDMSGTPMDQQWHCALARLADHADVLRQTWPESMLVELFAEAERAQPGIAPLPPPKPVAREAVRRARRKRFRPEVLQLGFGGTALAALCTRVVTAARALDAEFPDVGPLVLEAFAEDAHHQRSTYRAGATAQHAVVVVVTAVKQPGAPAKPTLASFEVVGLAPGCSLRGSWNGTTVDAAPRGAPALCVNAMRLLQAAAAGGMTPSG